MGKKYGGVIFDLDGTMLDTAKMNIVPLMRLIKEELGQDKTYEELLQYTAYAGKKTLGLLGFKDIEKSYQKWVGYVNSGEEKAALYDGWQEVIAALVQRGYRLGIVSSKLRAQYEIDFVPTGLGGNMDALILAEDTAEHKPHPMPLVRAAKLLGLGHQEILYVGDTSADAEACARAGMDFALALWGAHDDAIAAKYRPGAPLDLLGILK